MLEISPTRRWHPWWKSCHPSHPASSLDGRWSLSTSPKRHIRLEMASYQVLLHLIILFKKRKIYRKKINYFFAEYTSTDLNQIPSTEFSKSFQVFAFFMKRWSIHRFFHLYRIWFEADTINKLKSFEKFQFFIETNFLKSTWEVFRYSR